MINNTTQTILTTILIVVVTAVILGLPLMWLWNWLMPTIFYLDEITFWQALGLNALATIFFKQSITNKKD
jgi:hypothetical protein